MLSIIFDFGTTIGVLGLVFGIISVCMAIYYANRKKRDNQLKYIPGDFFNLYNTLLSNKFKLDIKYGEAPITNNIFYTSGKLVLEGDIKTKGNEISIILPEGWKWIDLSVEPSHADINADFKIDDELSEKAILTFDKFRREDNIVVSGIIEGEQLTSDGKYDFQKRTRFSHRIDDTDDIKVEPITNPKSLLGKLKLHGLILLSILSTIFLGLFSIGSLSCFFGSGLTVAFSISSSHQGPERLMLLLFPFFCISILVAIWRSIIKQIVKRNKL